MNHATKRETQYCALAKAKSEVCPVTSAELNHQRTFHFTWHWLVITLLVLDIGPNPHHLSVADNCNDHPHKWTIQVSQPILWSVWVGEWWSLFTVCCCSMAMIVDRPPHVQAVLSIYIHTELSRSPTHPKKSVSQIYDQCKDITWFNRYQTIWFWPSLPKVSWQQVISSTNKSTCFE